MKLRDFNNEYIIIKDYVENAKVILNNNNAIVKEEEENLILYKADLIKAQRANNEEECRRLQSQIGQLNQKIKESKKIVEQQKQKIEGLKKRLDSRIRFVQSDPRLSAEMDKALSVRYERKINKAIKDEDEAKMSKITVKNAEDLILQNPNLEKSVKYILSKTFIEEKLNKELERITKKDGDNIVYTDENEARRIIIKLQAINDGKRLEYNKIYSICENGDVLKEAIDVITQNKAIVLNQEGVDLEETFIRTYKNINRKIDYSNRTVYEYNSALNNIVSYYNNKDNQQETDDNPVEKIHWYNFIKRFRYWRASKKNKAMPAPVNYSNRESHDERKQLNYVLKYDVVKDAMKQTEKADLADVRNANNIEEQDDERDY